MKIKKILSLILIGCVFFLTISPHNNCHAEGIKSSFTKKRIENSPINAISIEYLLNKALIEKKLYSNGFNKNQIEIIINNLDVDDLSILALNVSNLDYGGKIKWSTEQYVYLIAVGALLLALAYSYGSWAVNKNKD